MTTKPVLQKIYEVMLYTEDKKNSQLQEHRGNKFHERK